MATNDERRRVAERLREYASWDDEGSLIDCQEWGESVLNLLDCGDTEGECYAALADLIEPDTTTDTTKDMTKDMTKSQTISLSPSLCDREALLKLADKMESQQYMREDARLLRWDVAARRIRETLGEDK